jgi:hypothetical protein
VIITQRTSAVPSRGSWVRGSPEWFALELAAAKSTVDILKNIHGHIKDGDRALHRARLGLNHARGRYLQAIKNQNSKQTAFDL